MHIVCPHCTTSYAINPATLGAAGRTVRCSRCKETWLARPEDVVEEAAVPAMAAAGHASANDDASAEWEAMSREEEAQETPVVDSPSISADWPAENEAASDSKTGHPSSGKTPRSTTIRLTTHRERLARLFRLPALDRLPGKRPL